MFLDCNVTATYDGRFILHCLDALLPLLEFESLIDYAFDLDLAAIEVVDCGWKFVGFTEGPNDSDFVANYRKKRLINIGHQFSGHPTFPATRVDAFLVPPPLINPPLFDQLPFPLL